MTTIYLIRHGETAWNAGGRLQGSEVDEPLSASGRVQAAELARLLGELDPVVIVSSPMRRCVETAAVFGITDPTLDGRWSENRLGAWSGRQSGDVEAADPDAYRAWRRGLHTPPGGEAFAQVRERVRTAVAELQAATPDGVALVFTHGGTIRAAVAELAGIEPMHLVPARPATAAIVRLGADAGRLAAWNVGPPSTSP